MAVSLSKIRETTGDENLVSLSKAAKVSLSKHSELMGHEAKVALVLDFSGSMSDRYSRGEVQAVAERALALGLNFDDDGAIDVFLFDDDAVYAGELGLTDYKGGVQRLITGRRMGYTNYAAAIDEVLSFYGFTPSHAAAPRKGLFGRHSKAETSSEVTSLPAELPVYCMFVTDGEPYTTRGPDARSEAIRAITAASKFPVFFQFMGLGDSFQFLEQLDNLSGRFVDNANFFSAAQLDHIGDEQLFEKMLAEYPQWIKAVQTAGLLK